MKALMLNELLHTFIPKQSGFETLILKEHSHLVICSVILKYN